MNRKSWSRWIVVCWCIGSVTFPQMGRTADVLPPQGLVRDVALDSQGALRGSLVSRDGKPQANSEVVLRNGREVLGTAKTQPDGSFAIKQVRPGLYEVATAKSSNVYRVWSARTAPPAAKPNAMLVEENVVVRGQEWSPVRRAVILGGVIITSGVIGGVIGYNIKDDDSAS
jgi:hypothetical protein